MRLSTSPKGLLSTVSVSQEEEKEEEEKVWLSQAQAQVLMRPALWRTDDTRAVKIVKHETVLKQINGT